MKAALETGKADERGRPRLRRHPGRTKVAQADERNDPGLPDYRGHVRDRHLSASHEPVGYYHGRTLHRFHISPFNTSVMEDSVISK